MRKKGFTFLEITIAMAIFMVMVVFVVKLDRTTHNQIRNISDVMEKVSIAQSELERLKSNPNGNLEWIKSNWQNTINRVVNDYSVTIRGTSNTNVYATAVEVIITVQKGQAGTDVNPYSLTAHLLIR